MAIECVNSTQPAQKKEDEAPLVFDSSVMKNQVDLPKEFIWADEDKPCGNVPELDVPLVDLGGFLSGDPVATEEAARLIGEASQKHGFFLVGNHGVDAELMSRAHSCMHDFFESPLSQKQAAGKIAGEYYGYSGSFTGRFVTNLPWKETLSFEFSAEKPSAVKDYLDNKLGREFEQFGEVYQEYCEAMSNLSLGILELLGMGLGVGRAFFREFYEDNTSIMRLNYYPICQKPDLTLGTGPHCDPTSLTILHQEEVAGLQVFADNQWCSVNSDFNAFVVNIGDTLRALTNGRCNSCLHRAVVNSNKARKSLAFFLNPKADKVISPPREFVDDLHPRICPDFTWPVMHEFTQKHYRADRNSLVAFATWLRQSKGIEIPSA